jgi:predicted kinase
MSKQIYVFRGAPASGKGTIVPAFCETLPSPVELIEQDKFRWGAHTYGREVSDIIDEEHMQAYRAMTAVYENYLKQGIPTIVVEGLFTLDDASSSQGNVSELYKTADEHGYTFKSIVLKASKEELLRRNANRGYRVPDDEFEKLYSGVYSKIGPQEIVIDSTGKTIQETVEEIGTFC